MKLQIKMSEPLNFSYSSRFILVLAPLTLVRIGPDLDTALKNVVLSLTTIFESFDLKPSHFATTYSLKSLVIIIDCFEAKEGMQLLLLRLRSGRLTINPFDDQKLSRRIANQLQLIQQRQPKLATPFRCVEDWYGVGPPEHPIYERMVKASTSEDNWQEFKVLVCI